MGCEVLRLSLVINIGPKILLCLKKDVPKFFKWGKQRMFRPHIYVDTSVIGGCSDKEFDAVKMKRQ
jgi:hypothetical protein